MARRSVVFAHQQRPAALQGSSGRRELSRVSASPADGVPPVSAQLVAVTHA